MRCPKCQTENKKFYNECGAKREQLTKAIDIFRECGADGWLA
jgi:hypothetical protein